MLLKSPEMPSGDFFERNEAKLCSPTIWHPGRCRSRLWVFSLGDEVPHIFIRESHQRPRKILISGGKRLFQQHRPTPEVECASQHRPLCRQEISKVRSQPFICSYFRVRIMSTAELGQSTANSFVFAIASGAPSRLISEKPSCEKNVAAVVVSR